MRGDFYEYAGVFLWFFSMLLRRCTRNVTKFIPSGSISGIDMNWYGLSIDGTVVQNQYPGIMGQITIIDIPSTTITNNTQEMRKLWVRCKIDGFLIESLRHQWTVLEKQSREYGWSDLALNEEKIVTAIKNIKGISIYARVLK